AAVLLHRLLLFVLFLRTDRQADHSRLAVDADVTRLDLLADGQYGARVLDALARQILRPQVALDAIAEVDARAALLDFGHGALQQCALLVHADELGERVLLHLLDAERDALPRRVDRQHDRFE